MNKFTAFLFIAVTCISGCSKHFQSIGEIEDQLVQSALPEKTSASVTPELDPARTCLPRLNDREKEQPALAPLVSESTPQQSSTGNLGADSPLFWLFSGEMGRFPISGDQATWLLDEKAHGQQITLGCVSPDLRNEMASSAGDRQQPPAGDPWNSWFTADYRPLFDNSWVGGKSVSIGISEMPFNSCDETLTTVSAYLKVSQGQHGIWLFGSNYSGTGEQPYPFPRIQYIWQPSAKIRANIGFVFPTMVDPVFDFSLAIRH